MTKLKITAVLTVLLLALGACGGTKEPQTDIKPDPAETEVTEPAIEEPEPIKILYPEPEFTGEYPLFYGGNQQESPLYVIGNRSYICTTQLSEAMGVDMAFEESDLRWAPYQIQENFYVSLADADRLWSVAAVFDGSGETVSIYKSKTKFKPLKDEASDAEITEFNRRHPQLDSANAGSYGTTPDSFTAAYIRLEDIMADLEAEASERFTHKNLEKLRVYAKQLDTLSAGFYIAWIPKYINPPMDIINDISRDFNFYNADFLYTLDVMVNSGGRIGLHGLTHQRGDQISAAGWEFDADAKLSAEEIAGRMDEAARICSEIGYEPYFFEFPHYGATGQAIAEANRRFSVVYHPTPYSKDKGHVDAHKADDGRTVYYVPTPPDSVHSEYDADGILGRLRKAHSAGNLESLFFHPGLDYSKVIIEGDSENRNYRIDEERSILRKICRYLDSEGYYFTYFDFIEQ